MTDLIDRNELIKALNKISMEHHESHMPMVEHDFRELVHEVPSTTVLVEPVVRCKNCRYGDIDAGGAVICDKMGGKWMLDDYCSYGKHKLWLL